MLLFTPQVRALGTEQALTVRREGAAPGGGRGRPVQHCSRFGPVRRALLTSQANRSIALSLQKEHLRAVCGPC